MYSTRILTSLTSLEYKTYFCSIAPSSFLLFPTHVGELTVSKNSSLTLNEWIVKGAGSGRDHLTIPYHIMLLPCGCTRSATSPPFQLRRGELYWYHFKKTCNQNLMSIPRVAAVRRMSEVKTTKTKRGNYFA